MTKNRKAIKVAAENKMPKFVNCQITQNEMKGLYILKKICNNQVCQFKRGLFLEDKAKQEMEKMSFADSDYLNAALNLLTRIELAFMECPAEYCGSPSIRKG